MKCNLIFSGFNQLILAASLMLLGCSHDLVRDDTQHDSTDTVHCS